jgi:hypothetical protein
MHAVSTAGLLMTKDTSIFSLRFGSNEELAPTREELDVFLKSPKEEGRRELHGNDLAAYRELLEAVEARVQHQQRYAAPLSFRDKMFYGVLGHSLFFSPVLAFEVEQFKYHLHTLLTLDLRKPASFIKSAEAEMSRLNPKKRDDAVKLARLHTLVEEREITLALFEKRRAALVRELGDIALYIRDNLIMIEKRCEAAIVILVDLQISRKKEQSLIEEMKSHFREQLRDSLRAGPVTRQYMETVKQDVARISTEISSMVREDVYTLTRLYEAVHDHAGKSAREIGTLMAETGRVEKKGIEDYQRLFAKIEKVLVSLISRYRFELQPAIIRSETAHEDILLIKRKELLDHVFELLKKERRSRIDRRAAEDRRKSTGLNSSTERRKGQDRRSGKKRRQ